jgi:AcrR family transcriptional regulator
MRAFMNNYHHGDLRAALLDAAGAILQEKGLEGFSLRECARRAGTSHAAPAHHFGDTPGLLSEFAALGFERMVAMLRAARAAAGDDAWDQLRATGRAYIDFALANRAAFQLMFRTDRLDAGHARLRAASEAAFGEMRSALAALHGGEADMPRLMLAWSSVHGFATLLLEHPMDGLRAGTGIEQFSREMGDAMLARLKASLTGG